MQPIEVLLEKSSLPIEGQKVKWQTQSDFDSDEWKEGTYDSEEQIFLVGFDDITSNWDMAWDVLHWQPIL